MDILTRIHDRLWADEYRQQLRMAEQIRQVERWTRIVERLNYRIAKAELEQEAEDD